MKALTWIVIRGIFLLSLSFLAACGTPMIRSDVTVFHDWPANLPDKSFVFERTKAQDNNLEYRSYENLVRAELLRLGFHEAAVNTAPVLRVSLNYQLSERDVRVVEPVAVAPAWGSAYWGSPYWGPRWAPYRYGPYYPDPFWYGPPVVEYRDTQYRLYKRHLHIVMTRASDNHKLFDETVDSEGENPSLATVMPYMVKSAFADFPGQSGKARRVELPFQK